jgi:hypothetical protein
MNQIDRNIIDLDMQITTSLFIILHYYCYEGAHMNP